MSGFQLHIFDARQQLIIDDVVSYVGEDSEGSFGLQAHHARFMTILGFGLSRFRLQSEDWQYLALPGGVLYFNDNVLSISTRHFLIDTDFEKISALLEQQLLAEEETLIATRGSLHKMERSMLIRLWNMQRQQRV